MQKVKHLSFWLAISLPALVGVPACGDEDETTGNGSGATAAKGGTAGEGGQGTPGSSARGGGGAATFGGETATGGTTVAGRSATAGSGGEAGDGGGAETGMGGQPSGGQAGASGREDCAGECTCETDAACNYDCTSECTVECLGARCAAHCPEGGCTLDADLGAVAAYTCEGGGCETDCDAESTCSVNCAGGGCTVSCDADSRCTVACAEDGEPCSVTCGDGGLATCSGNCELFNCEPCDPTPDPNYMPEIDPADFTAVIDNPLFPLPVGATWTYEASDEVITVEVEEETVTVMGVECVVAHDAVRTTEGDLIEDTRDWYAQDSAGNVWYFGEDTAEYVNGEVANTNGSWKAGVDGALPGIIMQAAPEAGMRYYQEYYVCQAEDEGEVLAVDEALEVPSGNFSGCVRIRDFTELDPLSNEHKTYCPTIGLVLVTDPETGEHLEELRASSLL